MHDEQALRDFIVWLPELEDNQKFILSLFARKKYCGEGIKIPDRVSLRTFVSNKGDMVDKIRQLEIPLGYWKFKGEELPPESLVLYIMPNPRCMKKATKLMGRTCWDIVEQKDYNLYSEALSCIQQSCTHKTYLDFDIDTKDISLQPLMHIFPDNETHKYYNILETRGGYHILVKSKKATAIRELAGMDNKRAATWYAELTKMFVTDSKGDQFMPVPGCTQGGFIPKMITI